MERFEIQKRRKKDEDNGVHSESFQKFDSRSNSGRSQRSYESDTNPSEIEIDSSSKFQKNVASNNHGKDNKGKDRNSQTLERNIDLVRSSKNVCGDMSSQSNETNDRSKYLSKFNIENIHSRHKAHDNNQFQRNVRGDSASGNTSDMLDRDGTSNEGERENVVCYERENVSEAHDQSMNGGQLLVIILFYEDEFVVVFVFL